jgi:hypothetical protein
LIRSLGEKKKKHANKEEREKREDEEGKKVKGRYKKERKEDP